MAKTVLEKEVARLKRAERRFLNKHRNKEPGKLAALLEEKVPDKLESTLDAAFAKAFDLIFSKGEYIISKSFSARKLVSEFEIDSYQLEELGRSKDVRKFKRRATATGTSHTMISAAAGITLGILGAWIPDIVIFIALLMRNMYQIAMRYGYGYDTDDEKKFMLRIIAAAVSDGEDIAAADEEINSIIRRGLQSDGSTVDEAVRSAAVALSHAMLYLKFVQNIPVIGVAGGISDFIYMERISDYAALKYQRRFLADQVRRERCDRG